MKYPVRKRFYVGVGLTAALLLAGLGQAAPGGGSPPAEAKARIGNELLQLIDATKFSQGIAMAESRSIPVKTLASGEKRIAVTLEPKRRLLGPVIDEALVETLGGEVDAISRSYMRVYVAISDIERLATHPDIALIRAPARPVLDDLGNVVSEAVTLTGARSLYVAGATGAGIKVGVLDSGFRSHEAAIAAGELPANTVAFDYTGLGFEEASEHGTIVAELLVDMAPDVELSLHQVQDLVGLENALDYARDNGLSLVSMSMSWPGHSYYDDTGAVSDMFNEARDVNGVLPVVSAGNYALEHWRGVWTDGSAGALLCAFEPQSFKLGAGLSLLGLGIVAVSGLLCAWRRG